MADIPAPALRLAFEIVEAACRARKISAIEFCYEGEDCDRTECIILDEARLGISGPNLEQAFGLFASRQFQR